MQVVGWPDFDAAVIFNDHARSFCAIFPREAILSAMVGCFDKVFGLLFARLSRAGWLFFNY